MTESLMSPTLEFCEGPIAADIVKRLTRSEEDQRRDQVSPPGAFPQLTALLEARRLEHLLTDDMFKAQPVFNCVWIYQLEMHEGETFMPGGMLVKSEATQAYKKDSAPRGILVGAGLIAMDNLKAHGIEPGHIVRFIKLSPFKIPVGYTTGGKEIFVLQMRDGDILASEDLATKLKAGDLRVVDIGSDSPDHRLLGHDQGECSPPKTMPTVPEDS
jgi:hypothetical protein